MIKMVVSSFYNTLIDNEEAIPVSTMLEIERIRKKGIIFSVCTNRFYKEILEYNKDFEFIDYIISLNGSYIYDVKKQKNIFKKKLSMTNIKKINKVFGNYHTNYYSENIIYTNYDDIGEDGIYKLEIELNDRKDKNIDKLKKLNVTTSILEYKDKIYLEITSINASMFNGVDQVSLKNNLTLKDILAICSNESDYSLVKNINNSYIVKNSCDLLKKTTKKITDSDNSKGVESVLKKI